MKATCWGLLLLATLWLFAAQAFSSYTYVDLHPPGWNESLAPSGTAWGEGAGYGSGNAGERGFLWTSGGHTELPPPGASGARAAWVNGQGDVAGTAGIGGAAAALPFPR